MFSKLFTHLLVGLGLLHGSAFAQPSSMKIHGIELHSDLPTCQKVASENGWSERINMYSCWTTAYFSSFRNSTNDQFSVFAVGNVVSGLYGEEVSLIAANTKRRLIRGDPVSLAEEALGPPELVLSDCLVWLYDGGALEAQTNGNVLESFHLFKDPGLRERPSLFHDLENPTEGVIPDA